MSIKMQIFAGMFAMIALVVGVGAFASFQTGRLAETFVEYRMTARSSLMAGEISEKMYEARLASSKYRLTRDPQHLEDLHDSLDEVRALLPQLQETFGADEIAGELEGLPILLEEYEQALEGAFGFQQQRDALVARSSELGLKARQQLSEVMETALRDGDAVASSAAGLAATNLMLARFYLERFLVDNRPEDEVRSEEEIEAARAGLTGLMAELQNPRRRDLTRATMQDLDGFDETSGDLARVIQERNALYRRMDAIGPEALTHVEAVETAVEERQNMLGSAGATVVKRSIIVVMIAVVLGALIGAVLAFLTGRSISGRLNRITQDMGELAEGNLDLEIEQSADKHEIGKMTNAMVVFRDNARKARDLALEVKAREEHERAAEEAARAREAEIEAEQRAAEKQERAAERTRMQRMQDFQADMERVLGQAAAGNFSNRMSKDIDDAALASLAEVINRLLEGTETNIADVVKSIKELAQGNLGIRIEGERQGVFRNMQEDFNAALMILAQTMAEIMDSGQTVSETSSHLERSSNDMSKRAEEAAAAIEQTSAAVEEITASIRQVVQNAQAANDATNQVRDSADETRRVSDRTEASINAMTEASKEINRVVKVIEDIAFQINLLALNAGVEAARAGEAGRGFSVVAYEVRALAQRSQEAVQEITQVIDLNNQSVETGVEQVALSRKAFETIIADVEKASQQISEITLAVKEQSVGIEEVNTAVRSIDQTAQTNAASLEEMTAASISMSGEATTLAGALQKFHGVDRASRTYRKAAAPAPGAPVPAPKLAAVGGGQAAVEADWNEF